ncbi:MAG: serine acetyltransferase, partial [Acidobacteria bacterium]|nr:serine acetyltransferase [Acidobacteriota bacterium]
MTPGDQPSSTGAEQAGEGALRKVVERLCAAQHDDFSLSPSDARPLLPSRDAIVRIVEALRSALFPGYFGDRELDEDSLRFHIGATLDRVRHELLEQIRRALCFVCQEPDPWRCAQCETRATAVAHAFLARLPDVRRLLGTDVQAAYDGDPAATSPSETILCYPGILAITNYRLAHELSRLDVVLVPRMIT